mgnify:CR=1 FL=1
MDQEDALSSVGVGHAFPKNGFQLLIIHWFKVEVSVHVFLKDISVLFEYLDFICEAVVNHADGEQGWWINQTLGDA